MSQTKLEYIPKMHNIVGLYVLDVIINLQVYDNCCFTNNKLQQLDVDHFISWIILWK